MTDRKLNIRRIVFTVLLLLWMGLIFYYSSRNADLSQEDSHRIGWFVGNHFMPGFRTWSESTQLSFVESSDFLIRKTAHFTEYAILGLFAFFAFSSERKRRGWIPAVILCVLYAVSDEIHQYFVPGRACMFRDICIDSAGAAAMILLLKAIFRKVKNESIFVI